MIKIDEELATFIEKAISESVDYCEALDKVIEWRKKNRGLRNFHAGVPLDVLCGTRKVEDPVAEANNVAKDTLMVMLASAKWLLKKVTDDELARM